MQGDFSHRSNKTIKIAGSEQQLKPEAVSQAPASSKPNQPQ